MDDHLAGIQILCGQDRDELPDCFIPKDDVPHGVTFADDMVHRDLNPPRSGRFRERIDPMSGDFIGVWKGCIGVPSNHMIDGEPGLHDGAILRLAAHSNSDHKHVLLDRAPSLTYLDNSSNQPVDLTVACRANHDPLRAHVGVDDDRPSREVDNHTSLLHRRCWCMRDL